MLIYFVNRYFGNKKKFFKVYSRTQNFKSHCCMNVFENFTKSFQILMGIEK